MSVADDPELTGYEPGDGTPLRSRRTMNVMRIVVVLGVLGMILPGVITTVSVGTATAEATCTNLVAYYAGTQSPAVVRWELFGPGLVGWECYADGFGGEKHVGSLGLIPMYREVHPARVS